MKIVLATTATKNNWRDEYIGLIGDFLFLRWS